MRIRHLSHDTRQNLLEDLLKRSPNQYPEYEKSVAEILEHVKKEKDQALFAYTEKFDGAKINAETIKVTEEEIEEAYAFVGPELLGIIRRALHNIEVYHEKQKQYSWFDSKPDGTILGQKVTPLQRVGVYVPGGKAAYPSSVLMNIMPAKVAGVEKTARSFRRLWLPQRKPERRRSIRQEARRQSERLHMVRRVFRRWIRSWDLGISMWLWRKRLCTGM